MPLYKPKPANEFVDKVISKMGSVLPPGLSALAPPTPKETGKAWDEVIEDPPKEGTYILPFMPNVNLKKLGKAVYGTAAALTSAPGLEFVQPMQIGPVFHGSPYKFTKFKNKAIGTGEGAQAFGYGHYVSEADKVGKSYAGTSIEQLKNKFGDAWESVGLYHKGEKKIALQRLDELIADQMRYQKRLGPMASDHTLNNYQYLRDKMVEGKLEKEGYLYEATLHKGKTGEQYLEWDKPISDEMKRAILGQVKKENLPMYSQFEKDFLNKNSVWTGEKLYKELERTPFKAGRYSGKNTVMQGERDASNFLQRSGISGIKYPAGSLSGMKGTGKSNYVVFNPEDITIEGVK